MQPCMSFIGMTRLIFKGNSVPDTPPRSTWEKHPHDIYGGTGWITQLRYCGLDYATTISEYFGLMTNLLSISFFVNIYTNFYISHKCNMNLYIFAFLLIIINNSRKLLNFFGAFCYSSHILNWGIQLQTYSLVIFESSVKLFFVFWYVVP
jgi:hypothetical protein